MGKLPFYRKGNRGSEKLSNSSRVMQQNHSSNPGQPGVKALNTEFNFLFIL